MKGQFAIISCLILGACISNQPRPKATYQIDDVSVSHPEAEGWVVLEDEGDVGILFGKKTSRGKEHTLRAGVKIWRDQIVLKPVDLYLYVEKKMEEKEYGHHKQSNRLKNIHYNISGTWWVDMPTGHCVLSEYKIEDHGVPDRLGQVYLIQGKSYFCPNPYFYGNYVFEIYFSQRYLKDENRYPLDSELKPFITSPVWSYSTDEPSLLRAVKTEDVESVAYLIEEGVDINVKSETSDWGKTPLIEAAIRGNLEIARLLVDAGANVNKTDDHGNTALMACAAFGHQKLANFLLDSGANVDASKPNGTTALMIASLKGELEIVKLLIIYHADINVGYGSGDTALTLADRKGYKKIVQELVNAGARY